MQYPTQWRYEQRQFDIALQFACLAIHCLGLQRARQEHSRSDSAARSFAQTNCRFRQLATLQALPRHRTLCINVRCADARKSHGHLNTRLIQKGNRNPYREEAIFDFGPKFDRVHCASGTRKVIVHYASHLLQVCGTHESLKRRAHEMENGAQQHTQSHTEWGTAEEAAPHRQAGVPTAQVGGYPLLDRSFDYGCRTHR